MPGEGAAPPPWATAIADLPPLGLQDALERAGELRARVGFSSRVLSFSEVKFLSRDYGVNPGAALEKCWPKLPSTRRALFSFNAAALPICASRWTRLNLRTSQGSSAARCSRGLPPPRSEIPNFPRVLQHFNHDKIVAGASYPVHGIFDCISR